MKINSESFATTVTGNKQGGSRAVVPYRLLAQLSEKALSVP